MLNLPSHELHSIVIVIILSSYLLITFSMWIRSLKNRSLLSRNRTLKKLKKLSWDDFERLCMELFEKQGWKVLGNEKKGADGGVDIWMKKSSFGSKTSAIVQCKRYEDARVTIKVIREMYGLMYEYEVEEAYIVTTSRFTKECYKFIEEKKIVLIDGEKLVTMIN